MAGWHCVNTRSTRAIKDSRTWPCTLLIHSAHTHHHVFWSMIFLFCEDVIVGTEMLKILSQETWRLDWTDIGIVTSLSFASTCNFSLDSTFFQHLNYGVALRVSLKARRWCAKRAGSHFQFLCSVNLLFKEYSRSCYVCSGIRRTYYSHLHQNFNIGFTGEDYVWMPFACQVSNCG